MMSTTTSWPAPRLLRELYDRFGAGGFLAAYNAGPSRIWRFWASGEPLKSRDAALPRQARGTAARTADWRRHFRTRRFAGLAHAHRCLLKPGRHAKTVDLGPLRGPAIRLLPFCRRPTASNSNSAASHCIFRRTPRLCSLRSRLRCRHDRCKQRFRGLAGDWAGRGISEGGYGATAR